MRQSARAMAQGRHSLACFALVGAAHPHAVVTALAGAMVVQPACAHRWLQCGAVDGTRTVEGRRTYPKIRGPAGLTDWVSRW
jgi:hypothetical protein